MSVGEALLVVLAGIGAGTINTIVGSGTLITFPTLVLIGVPPVTANISNNIGLVPAEPHRRDRVPARARRRGARRCGGSCRCPSLGALVGAVLLLVLTRPRSFRAIVPVLILLGVAARARRSPGQRVDRGAARVRGGVRATHGAVMQGGRARAGVYGGYFGAAQGVILMGILGALSAEPLQRLNGYKNVLATRRQRRRRARLRRRRPRPDRLARSSLLIAGGVHRRRGHRRDGRTSAAGAGPARRSSSSSASWPSSGSWWFP